MELKIETIIRENFYYLRNGPRWIIFNIAIKEFKYKNYIKI